MRFNIVRYDVLDSTNSEAARQARLGAAEGLCVIANEQTAGRGRHGRSWVSTPDAGLYFSIVLTPKIETIYLPLITLMSGVAVHDTIRSYGIEPDIKWVNDILVGEKKIAGILAETVESPVGTAVVVGIGINLRSIELPDDISNSSTSVESETSTSVTVGQVVEVLTAQMDKYYSVLLRSDGPGEIIRLWQARSTYFSGKRVRVVQADKTIVGVTDGLEDNGALRIMANDGLLTIVQAGDVERLRAEEDKM